MIRRGTVALLILVSCSLDGSGLNRDPGNTGEEGTGSSTSATGGSTTVSMTGSATSTGSTSATGTTSETVDGTSTSSGTADSSTGEEPIVCGVSASPPGSCDPTCDSCNNGVCGKTCTMGSCAETTIVCPPDEPCIVTCSGQQSCEGKTITCPSHHECTVRCFGQRACADAVLECGAGTCTAVCNNSDTACDGMQFQCGGNDGLIQCNTPQTNLPIPTPPEPATRCSCEVSSMCEGI